MDEMPPSGRNATSSILLVLTRSGKPGDALTIFASGAPWIEVKRLEPSGVAANFASNRPEVITVRWSEVCGLDAVEFCAGVIVIFAAPDVTAWSKRFPSTTKKSMIGAVISYSCRDDELAFGA